MPKIEAASYGIPDGITSRHIEQAAAAVDRHGIAHHRHSYRFDVVIKNKPYPPKFVISLAAKYAFGIELSPTQFHAHQAVRLLRKLGHKVIDRQLNADQEIAIEDDESAFPEGRERFRMHRSLERDGAIVRKAKALRLENTGKLECEVCVHDFAKRYGVLGEGYIEAHHKKPVSQLDGKTKTKIADLALVCPNCHRMLHRGSLSIKELRKLVHRH